MVTTTSKPIFTALSGEQTPAARTDRERLAGLDISALFEALVPAYQAHSVSAVTFNLFDDLVLSLRTALIEPFGTDGVAWRGQLIGVANVRGYLSVTGLSASDAQSVIAFGWVAMDGRNFEIRSMGRNKVQIVETLARPVACGDVLFAPQNGAEGEYYDAAELTDTGDGSVAVIHILALYPTGTKTSMKGGVAGIASMMATAQMVTNEAFHHSGIAARVEITAQELPSLRASDTKALLTEVTGSEDSEAWKAVSAAREKAQACIIALLAESATVDITHGALTMGQAAMIPEPPRLDASDLKHATFAVTLGKGGSPENTARTFAHELGHLLGGKHDRLTQPSRAGLSPQYDYVRGYVPPDKSFVTLMGYNNGGMSYVPAYSAADKKWNGKPLGIPMGKPGAADAAQFFRLSTHVVASYRGNRSSHPRESVVLTQQVDPPLGGTLLPSQLGPYAKGSVVHVAPLARVGYQFKSWTLDGKAVGSEPSIAVTMDKDHVLTAHFADGGRQYRLDIASLPATSNMQIKCSPPGPTYAPGTDVYVELVDASRAYSFTGWTIDGQPAGKESTLFVRMEQDHRIEARVTDSRELYLGDSDELVVEAGSTATLTVRVLGKHGGATVPGQWVTFALPDSSTGTKLEGMTRIQTDLAGNASVTLHAGHVAGTVNVLASLEGSAVKPIVLKVAIPKRFIGIVRGNQQRLFAGETSDTLEVQVRDMGIPVGAGVDVNFSMRGGEPDCSLTHEHVKTDAAGKAITTVTRSTYPNLAGRLVIQAESAGASQPAFLSIQRAVWTLAVVGERHRRVAVAGQPFALRVQLHDAGAGKVSDVLVHFELNGITSGIKLDKTEVRTDTQGIAEVQVSGPTAAGQTKIVARAAHVTSAPDLATLTVTGVLHELKAVGATSQTVLVGKAPNALVVQVLERGKPVGAGVQVHCAISGAQTTGLKLAAASVPTDTNGLAHILFAGNASGAGQVKIHVTLDTAVAPLIFEIWTIKNRKVQMSTTGFSAVVGNPISPVKALVFDEAGGEPGIAVHFKIDSGATGIRLESDNVVTDEHGYATVHLSEATSPGAALVTVSADDAKINPGLGTCQITVKPKP